MSSEIRTNLLKSRTGLSTVTLSDTGPVVTGIATFGVTTKIDGGNNVINVGTALTIGHTQGVQFHTQNLHSTGFEVNQVNASGIITASSYRGDGSQLTGIGGGISTDAYGNTYGGHLAGNALTSGNDDNVIIGREAGEALNSGDDNVFIGAHAGEAATEVSQSVLIGYKAGSTGQTGSRNVIIGDGNFNSNNQDQLLSCTFVGYGAGSNQQDSYNEYNTFLGYGAGGSSGSDYDVCIGRDAGNRRSGRFGIFIGDQPGNPFGNYGDMTGQNNIMIGRQTGNASTSGADNTLMGHQCGMTLTTGSNNLVLGHDADVSGATVSNEITLGDANITKFRIPGLGYVNDAGKVGIGTNNPARPLHIEAADCRIRLTDSDVTTDVELQNSSGDAVLTTNGASNIRLQTNNTERLRILSDGKVGIGTDNPLNPLEVWGSSVDLAIMDTQAYSQNSSGPAVGFQGYDSAGVRKTFADIRGVANGSNIGEFAIRTRRTGGTLTEALRITSGGKVKMESATNNQRGLAVVAPKTQINFGTTSDKGGFLMSEADGQFGISGGGYWTGSNWTAVHTGSAQIRHDGSAQMVFCTNSGLTVGNTFVPSSKFRITATHVQVEQDIRLESKPNSAWGAGLYFGGNGQGTSSTHGSMVVTNGNIHIDPRNGSYGTYFNWYSGGNGTYFGNSNTGQAGRIDSSGNLSLSGSYPGSDLRLKENIQNISGATDTIKSLVGKTFTWKTGTGLDDWKHYGFIAQEVQKVAPDLVKDNGCHYFDKDDNLVTEIDPTESDEDRKNKGLTQSLTVNNEGVIPILVEAMKEQQQQIEILKQENIALRIRVTNLEDN